MLIHICIDGLDPSYLEQVSLRNLQALSEQGGWIRAHAALPSVTNVNNVSLITGEAPAVHGIVGNYWLAPDGRGEYLENPSALRTQTLFEQHTGIRSLALVAKAKLLGMIGCGASHTVSAEAPDAELVQAVGAPPPIYSAEVSLWLFDALLYLLAKAHYDLVYLSTTDYVMHKYAPDSEEAQKYLYALDERIGLLMSGSRAVDIVVTADHGMNTKTIGFDPVRKLKRCGIDSIFIPAIKDRYVVHHNNLGGFAYLYLSERHTLIEAVEILEESPYVERVLTRNEAAKELRLDPRRIGDLTLLAPRKVVFGEFADLTEEIFLRSHGSAHESVVPFITNIFEQKNSTREFTYERIKQIYQAWTSQHL